MIKIVNGNEGLVLDVRTYLTETGDTDQRLVELGPGACLDQTSQRIFFDTNKWYSQRKPSIEDDGLPSAQFLYLPETMTSPDQALAFANGNLGSTDGSQMYDTPRRIS